MKVHVLCSARRLAATCWLPYLRATCEPFLEQITRRGAYPESRKGQLGPFRRYRHTKLPFPASPVKLDAAAWDAAVGKGQKSLEANVRANLENTLEEAFFDLVVHVPSTTLEYLIKSCPGFFCLEKLGAEALKPISVKNHLRDRSTAVFKLRPSWQGPCSMFFFLGFLRPIFGR